MRFRADGPALPDALLEDRDAGRVVFFCGAGVSVSSGMPDFVDLTSQVTELLDPPAESEITKAFAPWRWRCSGLKVPLDQIFSLLQKEYGRDEVDALITQRLSVPKGQSDLGNKHGLIKRISSRRGGIPQIVTTNFDTLFEISGQQAAVHLPPDLPRLDHGATAEGITYLHGRLAESDSARRHNYPYVLSSADFGRAYLSEAWATDFVRHLFRSYTVVFVGYSAEDPPIEYLLQGLSQGRKHDSSRLYVLAKGQPEDIEAQWRELGATAIAYQEHENLWQTIEAWAEYADDPRSWRKTVISNASKDPKSMLSHERGQVARVISTVHGARLLSEAGSRVHPEWICVLDAGVRSQSAFEGNDSFDPRLAYGLDDDQAGTRGDDLLA